MAQVSRVPENILRKVRGLLAHVASGGPEGATAALLLRAIADKYGRSVGDLTEAAEGEVAPNEPEARRTARSEQQVIRTTHDFAGVLHVLLADVADALHVENRATFYRRIPKARRLRALVNGHAMVVARPEDVVDAVRRSRAPLAFRDELIELLTGGASAKRRCTVCRRQRANDEFRVRVRNGSEYRVPTCVSCERRQARKRMKSVRSREP